MTSSSLASALSDLPIFPLPRTVFFPGSLLPLHIFEPRYRAMIRHCLDSHHAMAITLILDGADDAHGQPPIANVAGAGVITEATELPDGRFNILLRGEARVRLHELPFVAPFRRASAEVIVDDHDSPRDQDIQALLRVAASFSAVVRAQNKDFSFQIPVGVSGTQAADLVAQTLVLSPTLRQELLEETSPRERVRRTLEIVATQHASVSRSSGPKN